MALSQAQVVRPKSRRPRLSYVVQSPCLGALRLKTDQTTHQYTSEANEPEQDDAQHRGGVMAIRSCMSMSSAVSARKWLCFLRLLVTNRGDGYLLVQRWNGRTSVFLGLADAVSLRRTCVTQCGER